MLASARPYLQSKSPYWPSLAGEVQDAYVAKIESIGTAERAEQERKAKERDKAQHEKKKDPAGGDGKASSSSGGAGPTDAHAKKEPGEVSAQGGHGAGPKGDHKPPPAPPTPTAAAPATTHAAGPDEHATSSASAATQPHAGADASASHAHGAAGHDAGAGHDTGAGHDAKHHSEEEAEKKEEEKHKNQEEQLELEIQLLCQEALHHIAEGNAGIGAACDVASIVFPPAAAVLHPIAAIKSLGAAGLSLKSEYQEKWLSLAIKHMKPEEIEAALEKLQGEITSIAKLRGRISSAW